MAKVAALTMVYKDHWFLRKWMDYYGAVSYTHLTLPTNREV